MSIKNKNTSPWLYFTSAILLFGLSTALLISHLFATHRIPSNNANKISYNANKFFKPKGRTLVILVDSMRTDFCFNKDRMPFLYSCITRGASGISEVLSNPITISGDKSIFTGRIDRSTWSLSEDFSGKPSHLDNILRRLTNVQKKCVIFSSDSIRVAFGQDTDLSVYKPRISKFNEYKEEAENVFIQSHDYLKSHKWDFAVVQFVSVDFAGHLHTPKSEEYKQMSKDIDAFISKLIALTSPSDTVLITSEHGMDDSGCHVDPTPVIMNTPFLLWGPSIKKLKQQHVFQIDWTPTLSLLTGVDPVYNSIALPAVDLLKLKDKPLLMNLFAEKFNAKRGSTYNDLIQYRIKMIGVKKSRWLAFGYASMGIISIFLLILFILKNVDYIKIDHAVYTTLSVALISCVFVISGFWRGIITILPFRADSLMSHPFIALLFIATGVLLPVGFYYIFGKKIGNMSEVILLVSFATVFGSVFLYYNPYYPMCWVLFCTFLIGWLITKNSGWLIMFLSLGFGFALRRLTYIVLSHPNWIPDRMIFTVMSIIIFIIILIRKKIVQKKKLEYHMPLLITVVLITELITILPLIAPIRGLLVLLAIIPLVYILRKTQFELTISITLWMMFFYLGTSSSIASLSLLASFPLLIGLCLTRSKSYIVNGILVFALYWSMYIIPGNSFGYKVVELHDNFIMNSIVVQNAWPNIALIGARYIIPVFVIFALVLIKHKKTDICAILSVAILPLLCAIIMQLTIITFTGSLRYPWLLMQRLTVFLLYTLIMLIVSSISILISHIIKTKKRCYKEPCPSIWTVE